MTLLASSIRSSASGSVPRVQEPTLTVAELSAGVARVLARGFPDEVWVRGEIRDLNRASSGHVYFSLIDPSEPGDGEAPAVLPVTLFAKDRQAVNHVLQRSGALRMTDGVEVRIRGRVGHYAARGTVQLRMTWIDTDYTVGRLAADREKLIRALTIEGLLRRNARLPLSTVPLQVGVLTSEGSAAEADFLEVLRASGYAFSVTMADARVQGPGAPASLRAGLAALCSAGVEVIALIRGGGAATDLAAFDDEGLVRDMATAPVPLFTGIGHEVDTTVADQVAARAFGTPTVCAAALVEVVADFVETVDLLSSRITTAASGALGRHRAALGGRARHLVTAAMATTRVERVRAGRREQRLSLEARRALQRPRERIEAAEARALAHDPSRLLSRGWSITRDGSGRPVTSVHSVSPGSDLSTRVADGTIASIVTDNRTA